MRSLNLALLLITSLALSATMAMAQRPRLRTDRVDVQRQPDSKVAAQPNNEAPSPPAASAAVQQGATDYLVKFEAQGNPTGTSVVRDADGNVGIGIGKPESLLHISGEFKSPSSITRPGTPSAIQGSPSENLTRLGRLGSDRTETYVPPFARLTIDQHFEQGPSTSGFTFRVRSIVDTPRLSGNRTRPDFMITGGGLVGIGTDAPKAQLHIENQGGVANIKLAGSEITDNYDGVLHIRSGGDRVEFDGNDTVVVDVLQIKGGADFSENFDVNKSGDRSAVASLLPVEPGMVVSIDPESPGKLAVSSAAYDRRVAGIISGAGGVKPGMTMGQVNSLADGSHPVALSGRVYCLVDPSYGSVEPGDLLTTSDTPGYAMKVTNRERAQGAIIGKAMTGLKKGRGLVLVLVTLQ